MADSVLYTNEAALTEANKVADTIADSGAVPALVGKIRLFQSSLTPTPNTVKADLVAAETTLVGYPAGGYPLTDFAAAVFAPGGGAVISSNLVNVVYASGAAQTIGGYWVEDGAGNVRELYLYNPTRTLANVGDGWPIVVQMGYGRNAL